MRSPTFVTVILAAAVALGPRTIAGETSANTAPGTIPALDTILDGYETVTPADGGDKAMYTLYYKKDTEDLLAVLPADYEKQRILLTNTLAGGFFISGIQSGSEFLYWKRHGDRLALMVPELRVRTSGDLESQRSLEKLYTDRVRLDLPIVAVGPGDAPVIDMDALFMDQSEKFHRFMPGGLDSDMGTFSSIKVFPENISLSVRMPWRMAEIPQDDGIVVTLTFSMSVLPTEPKYTPREADIRVGYFHTAHDDLARVDDLTGKQRYIKRWKLEKADPALALSPPRDPIIFYLDHKTPIRYRRWVRDGILAWNKAFEEVGIVNAIEVYQQDVRTGAHMEKDPEDVHYNFIVWNSNYAGFAIGPCRVDPRNGRILDADVVFNDGWIRWGARYYRKYLAEIAMEGTGRETLDWLATRPEYDPRVRLAEPARRSDVRDALQRAAADERRVPSPAMTSMPDDTHAPVAAHDGRCRYGAARAMDLGLARLALLDLAPRGAKREFDDVPEAFIGPMVKDVIMHEIGHVLGLRHNFKGSTAFSLDELGSERWREEGHPISSSAMDYLPVNLGGLESGEAGAKGPLFMTTIGPYDRWAIRFGYADDDDQLESILAESTKPEHAYLTDEDLYGPDPTARTSDLGDNALDYVDQQMALVHRLRGTIIARSLKDGESYERARSAYMTLLGKQSYNLATAARYIGGIYVRRDRAGKDSRNPTEVAPAAEQRRALAQLIDHAFTDAAFGLTPELLDKMSYDKWMDDRYVPRGLPDPQLDAHDLVLGVQATSLTALFNPTKLRRIFDNEQRLAAETDAFTLAELFETVQDAVWQELDHDAGGSWSVRAPLISSLRRNLQREHLERTIDLALARDSTAAAQRQVSSLAARQLRTLGARIAKILERSGDRLDAYAAAHLEDAALRIEQALGAVHVYR